MADRYDLAVGGTREAEMSASIAILGLLIEQPDDVRGLERRLADCFPLARFAPTTAHNAVNRLKRQGRVRERERSSSAHSGAALGSAKVRYVRVRRALGEGRVDVGLRAASEAAAVSERRIAPRSVLEPTSQGVASFWTWMGSACPAPAVREELRAKMMFARPEDVPRLIELMKREIETCAREYEALHASIRAIEDHRAQEGLVTGGGDWPMLTRLTVLRDDADLWFMRANRLKRTCAHLEKLRDEAARRSEASARPRR
jgi:hypothetical protein